MAAKLAPMYEILPTDELKLLPTSRTLGCLLTSGIPRTHELKFLPRRTLHQCYTLRAKEDVSYGQQLCMLVNYLLPIFEPMPVDTR